MKILKLFLILLPLFCCNDGTTTSKAIELSEEWMKVAGKWREQSIEYRTLYKSQVEKFFKVTVMDIEFLECLGETYPELDLSGCPGIVGFRFDLRIAGYRIDWNTLGDHLTHFHEKGQIAGNLFRCRGIQCDTYWPPYSQVFF